MLSAGVNLNTKDTKNNRPSHYHTANYQWKHISSLDIPADLFSRGVSPSYLELLELWWSGPSSTMEEIIHDSLQNDLNSSEKELYLTELKTGTSTNLILSIDNSFINQIL
ncbi:hypothetical protein TNCV_2937091 [Trichonephila clavipes]|nr:hypothetical protein TNCV_2937091 [Trichonephila clavipes]